MTAASFPLQAPPAVVEMEARKRQITALSVIDPHHDRLPQDKPIRIVGQGLVGLLSSDNCGII